MPASGDNGATGVRMRLWTDFAIILGCFPPLVPLWENCMPWIPCCDFDWAARHSDVIACLSIINPGHLKPCVVKPSHLAHELLQLIYRREVGLLKGLSSLPTQRSGTITISGVPLGMHVCLLS